MPPTLSEVAIGFLEGNARDVLAAFDGDPEKCKTDDAKEAISFAGRFDIVINEYCTQPEFAGEEVMNFLDQLPHCENSSMDSFIAYEMVVQIHTRLCQMIGATEYLRLRARDTSAPVDTSAASDGSMTKDQRDRAISDSAQHGLASDDDVAKSTFGRRDVQHMSDDIRQSAMGDGDLRVPPEFRNLNPLECFRKATHFLVEHIIRAACGKKGLSLDENVAVPHSCRFKVILDEGVQTRAEICRLIDQAWSLVPRLKGPESGQDGVH